MTYQDRLQKTALVAETALVPIRMQTEATQLAELQKQAPIETASMQANLENIQAQTGYYGAQTGLIQTQTKVQEEALKQQQIQTGFLGEKSKLATQYFQAAQNTPSEAELKGRATADVMQSQAQQTAGLTHQLGAAGVNATSGRYTGALADVASAGVKALAQQRTNAGIQARQEKLATLGEAMKTTLS